jgi:hypothetical protein
VLHEDAAATLDATTANGLEPSIHAGFSNVALNVSRVARPGGGDMQQRVADRARAFSFTPPIDPESDREALEERAGLIAEGCGLDPATALREAHLCIGRARAWSTFIANAGRILAAPAADRTSLLARYRTEAAARYGEATARTMAGANCVLARC